MAVRNVILSDISQTELTDETHATVIIKHPDQPFALELDMSTEESAKLSDSPLRLVTITIHVPNKAVRTIVVEGRQLEKMIPDLENVLAGARRADTPKEATTRKARGTAKPAGDKRDYSSAEWAGTEHRGRTTETEASWVRENLDKANANRAREGQAPINPADPKMQKRYGFK